MSTFRGELLLLKLIKKIMPKKSSKKGEEKKVIDDFKMNDDMKKMMYGFPLIRMTSMAGMVNVKFSKEELLELNAKLNKIKKKNK